MRSSGQEGFNTGTSSLYPRLAITCFYTTPMASRHDIHTKSRHLQLLLPFPDLAPIAA